MERLLKGWKKRDMGGSRKQSNQTVMNVFTNWLDQALKTLPLTDPLYSDRFIAFKKLYNHDFVEAQKENYKYIALIEILRQLTGQDYNISIPTTEIFSQPTTIPSCGQSTVKKNTLTFINGLWSQEQSSFDPICQDVQLRKLSELPLVEQQEILESCRADLASSDDIFMMLGTMLSHETYLLKIADHVQQKQTIFIEHIITASAPHVVPRFILKVGKKSQVEIVENWYSCKDDLHSFVNNLTYIQLAEGGELSYHTLHTEYPSFHHVNNIYCKQQDHSTFVHHTFTFGSTMLRMNLTAHIRGSHATTMLYGLYGLGAKEKVDHHVQVIHSRPYSLSKQHYKGILSGQSIGAFNGKIYLTPEAQKTNAYQNNNAIVLSNKANHFVKPQLEIYADDVKCTHGATSGQLDREQLFYLQTRGISEPLAKKLLLEAFGTEIINQVTIPELKNYLFDKFIEKLLKL